MKMQKRNKDYESDETSTREESFLSHITFNLLKIFQYKSRKKSSV